MLPANTRRPEPLWDSGAPVPAAGLVAKLPPFVDKRSAYAHKPFAVILRGGATGSLVEIHHFNRPELAVAFYEEHKES